MLVRNVDTDVGLFNGALGVVTGFLPDLSRVPTAVLVLFDNQQLREVSADRHPTMNGSFLVENAETRFPVRKGNSVVEGKRLQFSLKVAFAMTIHKCQTLNSVVVSLKGRFGPGQAYVALSRCKSLDNLFITDFDAKNLKVNKSGLKALATMKNEQPLPLLHQPWLNDKGNSLRLAFLNTRSLQKHADDIMNSIHLDVCDVAVYAKTRLQDDNVPNQFSHSRLFCANAPRQHNYVGGLAIVVFTDVVAEQVFCVTLELFQMLVVRVSAKKQVVNIVAVYRSPALSIKLLYQLIDKHLRPIIADSSTPSLVIGDFNVDARQSTVLTDVIQQVKSATHTGGAILDHVYWTGETDRIATEVVGCHWSDHNIVVVRIGNVVATAAQDSSQVNRPPSISRLFTSASFSARCRRPEQTLSTPSKSSASSAVPLSSSTQSTALQHKTLPRISATCSFFDGALGPDRSHMEIDLPIEKFLYQYELRVLKARGDGHCLLYSWSKSTRLPVNNIKQQILAEYDVNSAMYQDAGVDHRELERYCF